MRILLTGATGYIGKRLLPVLIENGHNVICCVRDLNRFNPPDSLKSKIEIIELDLLDKSTMSNIPENIDGLSFKPILLGQGQQTHEFLYWEFPSYNGQQAVRMGKWKGIRKDIFNGNLEIELYDLEIDVSEKNNIASYHPNIVQQIAQIMIQEHEPSANERFKFKQLGDE